jgi:hypothetical protein
MGQDNGALQMFEFFVWNNRAGQETKAGIDAVNDPPLADDIPDGCHRGIDSFYAAFSQPHFDGRLGDVTKLGEAESAWVDFYLGDHYLLSCRVKLAADSIFQVRLIV